MPYSQKYCLVSFINSIDNGAEFDMANWPLHITLVDVFAIDIQDTNIVSKLEELIFSQQPVKTFASKEADLGTAEVVLLESTKELATLHAHLVDVLEKHNAIFNNPEFTREGFMPHCAIQKIGRLHIGDEFMIRTIALVDMFPNEKWQRRKIIKLFKLSDDI